MLLGVKGRVGVALRSAPEPSWAGRAELAGVPTASAPPLRAPPSQPRPTLAAPRAWAGWHCGLEQACPAAARPQPWAPRGSPGGPDPIVAPELAPRARLLQPPRTLQPRPSPKLAS